MSDSTPCLFQQLCPNDTVLMKAPRDRAIFMTDQRAAYVYHLHEGVVKCLSLTDEGHEITSVIVVPPQFIGLAGFVGMYGNKYKSHICEARAVTPVTYCRVKREAVWGLLDDRAARSKILDYICATMLHMTVVATSPLKKDVTNRISYVLKLLAFNIGKYDKDGLLVVHGLSHDDIASLSNTTRPTVTRVLNQMETDGQIRINRRDISFLYPEDLLELGNFGPLHKRSASAKS
jgi:CRP-like cAMP-binding protein